MIIILISTLMFVIIINIVTNSFSFQCKQQSLKSHHVFTCAIFQGESKYLMAILGSVALTRLLKLKCRFCVDYDRMNYNVNCFDHDRINYSVNCVYLGANNQDCDNQT